MSKKSVAKAKKTREKRAKERSEDVIEVYRLMAELNSLNRKLNSRILRLIP